MLFNAHKLTALAAAVYLAVTIYRLGQTGGLSTLQLAAAIAAGVCFVALIVTGGLLSAMKTVPPAIRSVHHILPYLALLCTAAGSRRVVLERLLGSRVDAAGATPADGSRLSPRIRALCRGYAGVVGPGSAARRFDGDTQCVIFPERPRWLQHQHPVTFRTNLKDPRVLSRIILYQPELVAAIRRQHRHIIYAQKRHITCR